MDAGNNKSHYKIYINVQKKCRLNAQILTDFDVYEKYETC